MYNSIVMQARGLPLALILHSTGEIQFAKTSAFVGILDTPVGNADEVLAAFFDSHFTLKRSWGFMAAEDFEYGKRYDYKTIPNMLQWLKQQALQNPFE